MSKLGYITGAIYIFIAIVFGVVGAYYVVNEENINIGASAHQSNESLNEGQLKKNGQVVNVDSNLCIREKADIDSEINYVLYEGMTFEIINKENEWYYIRYNNDIIGYVNEDYVEEYDDVPPNKTYDELEEEMTYDVLSRNAVPIKVELTAYCNCKICSESWGSETAMQTQTRKGVIAAPKEIPLGSRIYIPNMEYYKENGIFDVEDRGGAVILKDDGTYIIDVWLPDHEQVKEFGRKKAQAYILEN